RRPPSEGSQGGVREGEVRRTVLDFKRFETFPRKTKQLEVRTRTAHNQFSDFFLRASSIFAVKASLDGRKKNGTQIGDVKLIFWSWRSKAQGRDWKKFVTGFRRCAMKSRICGKQTTSKG